MNPETLKECAIICGHEDAIYLSSTNMVYKSPVYEHDQAPIPFTLNDTTYRQLCFELKISQEWISTKECFIHALINKETNDIFTAYCTTQAEINAAIEDCIVAILEARDGR